MTPVPRVGRVLDLVGLALFLGGGALFVRSWLGFREVRGMEIPVGAPLGSAIEIADGFWRLQRIGVALMVVGVAVFVLAWWVARRATGSEEDRP